MNAAFLQYDENGPDQQALYAWKNQWLAQRGYNVLDMLPEIKLPTLTINGDQDLFASLEQTNQLKNNVTSSMLTIIPHAGHLINYEYPALFHNYVIDFLQE